MPQAHSLLKCFSSQLLQTAILEDESVFPEAVAPVAIESCSPAAALAPSQVPGLGLPSSPQGLGAGPAFFTT